jgi:stage II sporulation protein D
MPTSVTLGKKKPVILSEGWRGLSRQPQPKDPGAARPANTPSPFLLLLLLLLVLPLPTAQAQIEPQTVRISVLSLFHPQTLILTTPHPTTLLLDNQPQTLQANQRAVIRSTSTGLTLTLPNQSPQPAQTLTLPAINFTLTVPAKLTRTYLGALTITTRAHTLVSIIAMPTEIAVASIVSAESPPHAPLEALKAQAIASRSFLLANPRTHADIGLQKIDACDTTHCQFLRSPPPAMSPASIATRATRGIVLTWQPDPTTAPAIIRAMYSRSCGGQTRTPANLDPNAYPFYSVPCDYCRRHPDRAAIYSHGHGIGLCQLGAADLAARGQPYPAILAHYFPNTTLTTLR